jgi:hypothetical protein
MGECQAMSVEEKSGETFLFAPSSVTHIAGDRMPGSSEMDPDLVGPSCPGLYFQQGIILELLKNRVAGFRVARLPGVDRHLQPEFPVPAHDPRNTTFFLGKASPDKAQIYLFYASVFELLLERSISKLRPRCNKNARSLFVQPVNNSRPLLRPDVPCLREMEEQSVGESSCLNSRSGMNDHSRRLINNDDIIIIIDNTQRHVLGTDF